MPDSGHSVPSVLRCMSRKEIAPVWGRILPDWKAAISKSAGHV
jgi:hypothetical protein